MPASKVSSMWKSWKAFRFSAMLVCAFSRSVLSVMITVRLQADTTEASYSCAPYMIEREGFSRASARPRQLRREQDRGNHALRIGKALPGDIERRAVIN